MSMQLLNIFVIGLLTEIHYQPISYIIINYPLISLPPTLIDTMNKVAIPQPHTNFMKNSFNYSRAVLWNSLTSKMWQADSHRTFRLGYKTYPH